MKKYTMLGISGFFLIFFFQNCGAPPATTDSPHSAGVISSNQQFNKYAVDDFPVLSMWDYKQLRYLDLDLSTGQMVAYEENGQTRGDSFQLPAEKLSELKTLLQSAEVCEPIVNLEERANRMCTMAYTYPYAILSDKAGEIRLGEKTDGCDVPVDLCGEKAAQLLTFTQSIVESL